MVNSVDAALDCEAFQWDGEAVFRMQDCGAAVFLYVLELAFAKCHEARQQGFALQLQRKGERLPILMLELLLGDVVQLFD